MKVIVKEAYPVMRIGLERLMKNYYAGVVIGCRDVSQVVETITYSDQAIDLVIFGMHADEVQDIKRLLVAARDRFQHDELCILVISDLYEFVYAPLCVSAGAKGFVSLAESVEVIFAAIKAVLLGGIFVNRQLARHSIMKQIVEKGQMNVFDLFSYREREVAKYLVKDISLREISDALNLSYSAVATYRDRILKKANVTHISHLSRLVVHRH